jgi:hypothetical protein
VETTVGVVVTLAFAEKKAGATTMLVAAERTVVFLERAFVTMLTVFLVMAFATMLTVFLEMAFATMLTVFLEMAFATMLTVFLELAAATMLTAALKILTLCLLSESHNYLVPQTDAHLDTYARFCQIHRFYIWDSDCFRSSRCEWVSYLSSSLAAYSCCFLTNNQH